MTDEGFIITNIDENKRDAIAFVVLKARLSMAIHFGRTDSMALAKARQLAAKYKWPEGTRTMKQCLRFIEAAIAAMQSDQE